MKGYDLAKILNDVKEAERKSRAIKRMLNNLLPSDVKELNQCIAINNMFNGY